MDGISRLKEVGSPGGWHSSTHSSLALRSFCQIIKIFSYYEGVMKKLDFIQRQSIGVIFVAGMQGYRI